MTDFFDNPTARFPDPEIVGPREWGEEILLGLASRKYMMKKIVMLQGKVGGLQYHQRKDEMGYMISGLMKVTYGDGRGGLVDRIIGPGTTFHFPTGSIHRSEALTDLTYIECSTPHFNDRVHVEDAFGIKEETGGLPSTMVEDIETK